MQPRFDEPIFTVTEREGWLSGWRGDVDPAVLTRLRGRPTIDAQLDLHGMGARQARLALRSFVKAHVGSARMLLVIVGKGRHSRSGVATLRDAIADWLCEPPVGSLVRAFLTADPADGGSGALYVLLNARRLRR